MTVLFGPQDCVFQLVLRVRFPQIPHSCAFHNVQTEPRCAKHFAFRECTSTVHSESSTYLNVSKLRDFAICFKMHSLCHRSSSACVIPVVTP